MLDETNCPVCGSVLAPDVPGGLCAACLLRQGLAGDESEPSGGDIEGVFKPGEFERSGQLEWKKWCGFPPSASRCPLGRFALSRDQPKIGRNACAAHHGDRYQLLGEIARGGMGAVLKGRDPDLGRDLAIKVLLIEHRDCPELAPRFIEEAQIGGQLQHPGIVPVYELGQFEDHRPYFAMKLVEGRTLAALLGRENAAQDVPRLLDIFEQVCQTMGYAHARGVIHRDLKPSNVNDRLPPRDARTFKTGRARARGGPGQGVRGEDSAAAGGRSGGGGCCTPCDGGRGRALGINQHHVHAARVDLLIRETELLADQAEAAGDDLARWAAAREAVRRFLPVVDDARDSVTRSRVATLGKRVGKLAQAAEADAKLVERLALVREVMDEIPATQTEAAYAAAFLAAGLDPHTQYPEEAGGAIARRPARTAVALAVALDHWAALRLDLGDRSSAGRITAVARAADPDPFRGRLRTALMEPRRQVRQAALLDLARSAATADLPPVTSALLGAGLLRVGDAVAAESVLRPAQRRHPAEAWLAQVLAKTLEKRSRPAEAIRYYLIARAARPESAHALAHALEHQGELTEAIAVFHEAIRLNPASAGHRFCLGMALKSQGHAEEADLAFDAAVAAGREALRHDAGDSLHHVFLGIVVERPDRLDEVVAAYRSAIRQRPDDGPAHYYLGTILAHTGQTDGAIAEFREAIRLKPDFTEGYIKLGLVLSNLKHDHAGAEKTLRDLIRFRADDDLAHFNLGCVLQEQGRLDEAIFEYRAGHPGQSRFCSSLL